MSSGQRRPMEIFNHRVGSRVNYSPKYIWITNDIRFVYWRACTFLFWIPLCSVDRRARGSPLVIRGDDWPLVLYYVQTFNIFAAWVQDRFWTEGFRLSEILRLICNFVSARVLLRVNAKVKGWTQDENFKGVNWVVRN